MNSLSTHICNASDGLFNLPFYHPASPKGLVTRCPPSVHWSYRILWLQKLSELWSSILEVQSAAPLLLLLLLLLLADAGGISR